MPELDNLHDFYGHIDTYANNAAGIDENGVALQKQKTATQQHALITFYGQ